VGRLDPVKRFPVLLRALLPWLAGDDRYLVVVGDGPGRADLERLARDGGVADRVRLLGPRTDLARLLSAFDVLASPSRDETYGIAVVEAVANGLPVVYAQCPALDDVGLVAPSLVRLPERPAPGTAPGPGPTTTTTDAADEVDLREAVQALLTATWTPDPAAARRERVPSALTDRYDVGRRTADVDDLYVRFLGGRRVGGRRAGGRDDEEAGCRHL
jgi:glycosyltransferase involved in cell wall biosynthesis